jgi:PIN domain nuclease of toxin-antitoxin system
MASEPGNLSVTAKQIIQQANNELYVSICSLWEMQIKHQLGKLELDLPLSELWQKQRDISGLQLLQVEEAHVWALGKLPHHHKDPFDRLLIAQAGCENIAFMSADDIMAQYDVETVW